MEPGTGKPNEQASTLLTLTDKFAVYSPYGNLLNIFIQIKTRL
jgi:hypothetical protein